MTYQEICLLQIQQLSGNPWNYHYLWLHCQMFGTLHLWLWLGSNSQNLQTIFWLLLSHSFPAFCTNVQEDCHLQKQETVMHIGVEDKQSRLNKIIKRYLIKVGYLCFSSGYMNYTTIQLIIIIIQYTYISHILKVLCKFNQNIQKWLGCSPG